MQVRIAIAIGLLLIFAGLGFALLGGERPFTGDNGRNIQLRAGVVIPAGERACQRGERVPAGSARLALVVSTAGRAAGPLEVVIGRGGSVLSRTRSRAGIVDRRIEVPIEEAAAGAERASVCVANVGTRGVAVLGQEVESPPVARVSDPDQPRTRAMRFEWFSGEAVTRVSYLGEVATRYGLAKAPFIATWTFWLAMAVLAGISAAAVALVRRELRR